MTDEPRSGVGRAWHKRVAAVLTLGMAVAGIAALAASLTGSQRVTGGRIPALAWSDSSLHGAAPRSRLFRLATRSYSVRRVPGGLLLRNQEQRFRARFGLQGLVVQGGGAVLGLHLSGYGYGDAVRGVGSVAPRAYANRVVYQRGSLTESYANEPAGLEQTFRLMTPPQPHRTGLLTLMLAVSGNMRRAVANRGDAVIFTGAHESLAYRGLSATDARGNRLRAQLRLRSSRLVLRIDDRNARYPLRIDPYIQRADTASRYPQAVLVDHPTVYYRLDETTGTLASDSSGNHFDASYEENPHLGSPGALLGDSDTGVAATSAAGNPGPMLSQSGDQLPAGKSARTLEAWVNYDNYDCSFGKCNLGTGAFNLFQYGDVAGGHGFSVQIGAGAQSITVSGDSSSTPVTATPQDGFTPPVGSVSGWHLLDVTYDGNTVEIYQAGCIERCTSGS